ncbi:hypothetical protein F0562_007227 [Nyssa sinensis]|uniref:Uncharacterized protein n=1 Tax=Nyssa sinensis TaxID=561372 RepID=A0A5J5A2R0_9ASTE|nr:hypothetical protein F0562_007227 [Nyssa sinensis]
MAVSSSCCLNLSPPPPSSSPSSLPSKTTTLSWPRKDKSWRIQCVVGVTCMIIGLEMGNTVEGAIAVDMQYIAAQSKEKVERWSDRRMCPPWQLNSLETIVPENLPRPAARRRWEAVGYSRVAPAIKFSATNCFSM